MTCDASWGYGVDFDVTCQLTTPHTIHRVEIAGNDGVPAVIEWPAGGDICPGCGKSRATDPDAFTFVEVRALCDPDPGFVTTHDCPPTTRAIATLEGTA